MESLTKTEERVMHILWRIKKGFVRDVLDQLPEPKPPYNTISSVIRVLEQKGFVGHKAYGKTHEYFPKVTKLAYKKFAFKNMISDYFDGSVENVVSFMVKEQDLDQSEIDEIKEIIEQHKKPNKK
ncbi:MAG: BlaI/MecI/CopY family transcriptional regulator [Bacteroidota bacterium]